MSQSLNSAIAVIGINIGKNSFHVVGLDDRGTIMQRQKCCPLCPRKRTSPNTVVMSALCQNQTFQRAKSAGEKVATPASRRPGRTVSRARTGWLQLASGLRITCVSSCQIRQTARQVY